MAFPAGFKYTKSHEYIKVEGKTGTVGLTNYAQDQLGDIVFVELPPVGKTFEKGEPFGVVESVKAVADLYAPIGGEVVEVNAGLADRPEQLNEDCYGDGWMVVLAPSDAAEAESLLDAGAYEAHVRERSQ